MGFGRSRADRGRWDRIDVVATLTVCAASGLLALMLARVTQLQVAPGPQLSAQMSGRISGFREPGVRGDLRDVRGRTLAATRFGDRVAVDPSMFPNPPGDAMTQLADAIGMPVSDVAERLVPRMEHNVQIERARQGATGGSDSGGGGTLIRYVSIGPVLQSWRADRIRRLAISGVTLETRSVRKTIEPDLVGPIVGFVGVDNNGLLGAEHSLDEALSPTDGRIRYVRDARGRPLWIEPEGQAAAQRGEDIRLSIDLELQRIAMEELKRGVEEADAEGGRVLVMDPRTGEVLAMGDIIREVPDAVPFDWDHPYGPRGRKVRYRTTRPDPMRRISPAFSRCRCVEDVYEPGSTFKPFMWSATTQLGLAKPDEIINTEGGVWRTPYGRSLKDVERRDHQTWAGVLVHSSNIGMAKVTRRMTDEQMRGAVLRFGFGKPTGIGYPGEAAGLVTSAKAWSKYTQTSVAMGHEIAVTPIQIVHAFCAFARDGDLAGTLPQVRLIATGLESTEDFQVRVLSPKIALLTRQTLRGVTHNLDERLLRKEGPDAEPFKYELFGKSGTAEIPLGQPPKGKRLPRGLKAYYPNQYNSSFIAGGPVDHPRLVTVVVIDDPGPARIASRTHYGSAVAGPVVRRVMERALTYLGVPADPPKDEKSLAAIAD